MSLSKQMESDGLADKPSRIYGFEGPNGDIEIRELVRSGYGELRRPSPGDVEPRSRSDSDPDQELPSGPLPQRDSNARDDCGEDTPGFACDSCGDPTYVERTCGSPLCHRCWAAAIKNKTKRLCGKLDGLRRLLYARSDCNVDFQHIIASLPTFMTDSEDEQQTHDRALEIIKVLLRENWGIESFLSIYHEKRIKAEYRADSLDDHGGEPGRGEMTWSDILSKPADERDKYLKREPHFHLFIPTKRGQFDYSVTEAVENKTGWMFHRSEKSGEDNYVSVRDLEDLVRQVTYCMSHAMVNDWNADRNELTTRMKGELHNCYIPDGVEDEVLSYFVKCSQKLLGVRFEQHSGTCDAEVDEADIDSDSEKHPLEDVWGDSHSPKPTGGPIDSDILDLDAGGGGGRGDLADEPATEVIPDYARGPRCGGTIRPIREVAPRLDDDEWRTKAAYSAALAAAVEEWQDDGEPEVDQLTPD